MRDKDRKSGTCARKSRGETGQQLTEEAEPKKHGSRRDGPTSALFRLARSQDWPAATRRCASHPQDARYTESGASVLHCALHRKPRSGEDRSADGDRDARREVFFLEFVGCLMQANPHLASFVDLDGYTPLHVACGKNASLRVVEVLLRRCPPGADMLHDILGLPLDVSRKVLTYVPNPALMKDTHGKTPLFLACQWSKKRKNSPQPEVVRALLDYAPEAKHIRDKTSRSPLDIVRDQKKSRELIGLFEAEQEDEDIGV